MNFIVTILFALLPFSSAFGITGQISLTFVAWAPFAMFFALRPKNFRKIDIAFGACIALMLISTIVNCQSDDRAHRYVGALILCFLVYQKSTVYYWTKYPKAALRGLCIGLILTSLFMIYEFTTVNFARGLFIELPRPRVLDYNPLFGTAGSKFVRARGFSEESGHAAFFLEFAFPFLLLAFRGRYTWLVLPLVLLAFFCSASTASLLLLPTATFVVFIALAVKGRLSSKQMFSWTVAGGASLAVLSQLEFFWAATASIIDKAKTILSSNSGNYDRFAQARFGWDLLIHKNQFFGIGPMQLDRYGSVDSTLILYLDLALAGGVAASLFFIIFTLVITYQSLLVLPFIRYYLLASAIMVFAHYLGIANFYYPWMWILYGIIQSEVKQSSRGTSHPLLQAPLKKKKLKIAK